MSQNLEEGLSTTVEIKVLDLFRQKCNRRRPKAQMPREQTKMLDLITAVLNFPLIMVLVAARLSFAESGVLLDGSDCNGERSKVVCESSRGKLVASTWNKT